MAVEKRLNWKVILLICGLIAIATVAVYWQVTGYAFVNIDDGDYVVDNSVVMRGLTWEGTKWAFTTAQQANWHPLVWLSLMLDAQLGHGDPAVFHATNVVLHMANVLILLLLLNAMTGMLWPSAFVAGLFALHPLQVESVAWVSERKDVLSALFWMLTALAYVRYTRKTTRANYILVMALFALGLMAKQMLVTLPVVLLLLDYWPLRRVGSASMEQQGVKPLSSLVVEKIPMLALSVVAGAAAIWAQTVGGSMRTVDEYPIGVRAAYAPVSYLAHLGKAVFPVNLSFFYPHPGTSVPEWKVAGSALVLVCLTLLAVAARRKRPYVFVGWLWYFIVLFPMVGLLQSGEQAMCDHHSYIALIGLFIAVAWLMAGVSAQQTRRSAAIQRLLAVAAVFVLAACAATAYTQAGCWRDSRALSAHALQVTHNNWMAHSMFARELLEEGSLQSAIDHFHQALRINPKDFSSHSGLGAALASQGDFEGAAAHFREVCKLFPDNAPAWYYLGSALARLGKYKEALGAYGLAVKYDPNDLGALQKHAIVLTELGRYDEAVRELRRALKKHPGNADLAASLEDALEPQMGAMQAKQHAPR